MQASSAFARHHAPILLHYHIKPDGTVIFRYLFHDSKVRYLEVEKGTSPPFHDNAPQLLSGRCNYAVLAKHPFSNHLYVKSQTTRQLQQVHSTWHPFEVDHMVLGLYNRATTTVHGNVFMPPKSPRFPCNIVVKLAHAEDQIPAIQNECDVYQKLEDSGIAPRFIGYVTEEGRKIGFIVEKLEGARHAELRDAMLCDAVVKGLHARGIVHNDCHNGNVLIKDGRAFLVDFETATIGYGDVERDWHLLRRALGL